MRLYIIKMILLPCYPIKVQIAKRLIDTHKVVPKQIAALSPYSAQREEIKKQLERQHVTGVQVKTITESQGDYNTCNHSSASGLQHMHTATCHKSILILIHA